MVKNFRIHAKWIYSLVTGIFIYIFLKIFQPFGFDFFDEKIMEPLFIGYSVIGFSLVLINHFIFGGILNRWFPDKEALFRKTVWPLWITLTIVVVNIFFTRWYFLKTGIKTMENFNYWPVIIGTLAIGILCVVLIELFEQNIRLKQNLNTVAEANEKLKSRLQMERISHNEDTPVEIIAQNEKDLFRFELDHILFLAAEENYVAVHYWKEKQQRMLIRSTLTRLQEQVNRFHPVLFRCHRRYIVNIKKIISVSGNAQGFRLFLENVKEVIPVSRRYIKEFRGIVDSYL